MDRTTLKYLLDRIRQARIGVVGDFCLDVYLLLDSTASETSLETGLSTLPVRSHQYALGGAGNVANNLCAMGVNTIAAFGVTGEDSFGTHMREMLLARGIDCSGIQVQRENWDTHVYMKPHEREHEERRLDFGGFNQLHPATRAQLLDSLHQRIPDLDIVIVNQQVARGIHTQQFREDLGACIRSHPETQFIVDSRHFADDYANAMRKLNLTEAARLCHRATIAPEQLDSQTIEELARELSRRWNNCIFLTGGERGCAVFDNGHLQEIPGLLILAPVDPVGAGDSTLAGIAAALAVGAAPGTAAELGNLVAGVTVQKLMQTGTASPEEILNIGSDPDCRYRPDLARQAHKAVYYSDTDIEIVSSPPRPGHITHAIFDHDGTVSTLRQGWEEIMEPMMIAAITGARDRAIDPALYDHVRAAVRAYIDKTTGIQTLVQMRGLVHLVRQFRCVDENDILDEHGYKKLYNQDLMNMVDSRMDRLRRGQRTVEDFTINGAVPFLHALHQRGVMLYLASGTDQADVEREAEALGYRALFGERIYGAVGDITKEAKRMVLERILSAICNEAPERIVAFGDGPVEIRETHKRGGYTVGVASDEIRRYGLAPQKRRRLIEAGADLVIPDFSASAPLLNLLFGG
jgi:rfaE bifunctional protein kinase chain/domain